LIINVKLQKKANKKVQLKKVEVAKAGNFIWLKIQLVVWS